MTAGVKETWRCAGSFFDGWRYTAEWSFTPTTEDQVLWVDFCIWPIIGNFSDDSDTPAYQRKGSSFGPDCVTDTEGAEMLVKGYLKWDGCNELDRMPEDQHRCGLAARDDDNEALQIVMRTAARTWMKDTYTVDEVPMGPILEPDRVGA